MNTRTMKRLGVALAVLVVVWLGLGLVRRVGRDRVHRMVRPRFDAASVNGALIVHGGDTLRFVLGPTGWAVNGHAADGAQVRELVGALADTNSASDLVAEHRSSLAALGLDIPTATSISLFDGRRQLIAILVGLRSQDYSGVYVRMPRDSAAYRITWGQLADLATEHQETQWWNRIIAQVAPESVTDVAVRRGRTSYTLTRGATGWTLGSHAADSSKVATFLDHFRDLESGRYATPAQADSARFPVNGRTVQLMGAGGRPLLVLRMDSTKDGVWTERDGDNTIYNLDNWTANGLTPADTSLLPGPASAAAGAPAAKAPVMRPAAAAPLPKPSR